MWSSRRVACSRFAVRSMTLGRLRVSAPFFAETLSRLECTSSSGNNGWWTKLELMPYVRASSNIEGKRTNTRIFGSPQGWGTSFVIKRDSIDWVSGGCFLSCHPVASRKVQGDLSDTIATTRYAHIKTAADDDTIAPSKTRLKDSVLRTI